MASNTPMSKKLLLATDLSGSSGMAIISALLRFRVKFILSDGILMFRTPFNTNNREHTT
jgi:hypothetical protein